MRINKPVSLNISILCQSKTVMYEFFYDYVKPKCGEIQNIVIWIQKVSLLN